MGQTRRHRTQPLYLVPVAPLVQRVLTRRKRLRDLRRRCIEHSLQNLRVRRVGYRVLLRLTQTIQRQNAYRQRYRFVPGSPVFVFRRVAAAKARVPTV